MADTKPTTTPVVKAPAAPAPAPATKPLKLPNKPATITAASKIPLPADNNHHMMYMTTCLDRVAFF